MKWTQGIDKLGLSLYLFICLFAVANIYSVDPDSGVKQAIFLGLSIFIGGVIFLTRSKFFENTAIFFYVFGVLLLVGLFPFGTEVLGQKNWYRFGGMSFQPVEFAKLSTALLLAKYVSEKHLDMDNNRTILIALVIVAIPAVVVLAIPDVGSMLVFSAFTIVLYREGLNGWFFVFVGLLAAIFLGSIAINPIYIIIAIIIIALYFIFSNYFYLKRNFVYLMGAVFGTLMFCMFSYYTPKVLEKLPKHQRERIEVLYKGERAFRDTSGYNLLYSKTAIGSGGLFGKGFRQGSVTQGKFVPEQRTDYIFCTVGEEWGFLGSTGLLILYAVFIGRVYYLSEQQKTVFNRVFGYSFASILLLHFVINISMVMGLFPTVGIPLPFFSSGGTSLIMFSVMTFIFFKLNYTDRNSLI